MTGGRLLGVVLTGGRGRRFGGSKAEAEVAGIPMAERTLRALAPWTDPTGRVQGVHEPSEREVPSRRDRHEGRGPLEGLTVALEWAVEADREGAVVLACDLPLMTADTVGWLVEAFRARPAEARDGVVPRVGGQLQPLAAVYSVGALPGLRARLGQPDRSLMAALRTLAVHPVTVEAGTARARCFLNVNTREDLERALDLMDDGPEPTGATGEPTGTTTERSGAAERGVAAS